MKKTLTLAILSLFLFVSTASALEFTNGPKLVEATPTTLKVEWDKVDQALGYYLYYGTISGVGIGYQKQYSEFLEATGATIPDLEAGKDYYVAVTAVDDQGEEGKYSEETLMKTLPASGGAKSSSVKFALQKVKVLSAKSLELTFSNDLDSATNAQREFKLVKKNEKNEILITSSKVSGNKATLELASELQVNEKYDITVINIQDVAGKSIESGVDALSTFTVPTSFVDESLNSASETGSNSVPLTDVTSGVGGNTLTSDYSGNVGQNIEVQDNTLTAAQDNEKLPKTGPETTILLFLATLLGLGIYFYKRKRVS